MQRVPTLEFHPLDLPFSVYIIWKSLGWHRRDNVVLVRNKYSRKTLFGNKKKSLDIQASIFSVDRVIVMNNKFSEFN